MVWEWRIERCDAASRRSFFVCTAASLTTIILSKVTLADTPAWLLFDQRAPNMSSPKQYWD
jgi:hypothetical protein